MADEESEDRELVSGCRRREKQKLSTLKSPGKEREGADCIR